jgi:hypothetical protein
MNHFVARNPNSTVNFPLRTFAGAFGLPFNEFSPQP